MKIKYKICQRCNENVRRTYEGMCGACWRYDHAGAGLPKADRAAPRKGTRKRRWRRMPESEKLRQQVEHIKRLDRRERNRVVVLEEDYTVSDARQVAFVTSARAQKIRHERGIRYKKEWRKLQREALLPKTRLCSECKSVVLSSRKWVVRLAYETKEETARAHVANLETGEPLRENVVMCLKCWRKQCGSSQKQVS